MQTQDAHNEKTALSISRRGRELQGSPIRKLAAIAEARKKQGIHVYHLNIGQPDLPSPLPVMEAIHNYRVRQLNTHHQTVCQNH
jgi:aspartate aminotransferase